MENLPLILRIFNGKSRKIMLKMTGEHIKLQIVPMSEMWQMTPDIKALSVSLMLFSLLEPQLVLFFTVF